ncbi:MAG TPA: HAD-IA family hydrolase [Patescibacteria group bacterium]|nr:HAD-IA family hydrolase [Patescibacteria group bacterium]
MIKAIIFDCFGVLAVDSWLPFKDEYFGNDRALFEEASNLNRQADNGFISYDEFIHKIAELAHVDPTFVRHEIENNPANTPLFRYIAQYLKPKYKLGFLSNSSGNWLDDLFTKEQIALFDNVLLSFETGYIKPDPRAYQASLNALGVEASEAVMVDDQPRYCDAAKELGMTTVWYQGLAQFKHDLEHILSHT